MSYGMRRSGGMTPPSLTRCTLTPSSSWREKNITTDSAAEEVWEKEEEGEEEEEKGREDA